MPDALPHFAATLYLCKTFFKKKASYKPEKCRQRQQLKDIHERKL
jgi:hypothetical protein